MSEEEFNDYMEDIDTIIDNYKKENERLQRQKEELQVNGLRQETLFKLEIERLNNIINLCKDEMYMTTYKDMNNCEKWESKMNAFIDILDKIKELRGDKE